MLTTLTRLWRRLLERVRCFRGDHQETVVFVAGELRVVCMVCPHAETLGKVRRLGSNFAHHHDEP